MNSSSNATQCFASSRKGGRRSNDDGRKVMRRLLSMLEVTGLQSDRAKRVICAGGIDWKR